MAGESATKKAKRTAAVTKLTTKRREMKTLLMSLLGATVLLSASLLVPAAVAQNKRTATTKAKRTRPESYPRMREAIAALEVAKAELEQANGDFGGHKSEAIEAITNALKRLRLALQFEKY
jgi:hypothetical protein